jgi:hypothetical protein
LEARGAIGLIPHGARLSSPRSSGQVGVAAMRRASPGGRGLHWRSDQVDVDEGRHEGLANDAGGGRVTGPCVCQRPTTGRRRPARHLTVGARRTGEAQRKPRPALTARLNSNASAPRTSRRRGTRGFAPARTGAPLRDAAPGMGRLLALQGPRKRAKDGAGHIRQRRGAPGSGEVDGARRVLEALRPLRQREGELERGGKAGGVARTGRRRTAPFGVVSTNRPE